MRERHKTDIRVTVYTGEPWLLGKKTEVQREAAYVAAAEQVAGEIRRHVDDLRSVNVEWTLVTSCSFCGYEFDASEKDGDEPACCDEAIAEFIANDLAEQEKDALR